MVYVRLTILWSGRRSANPAGAAPGSGRDLRGWARGWNYVCLVGSDRYRSSIERDHRGQDRGHVWTGGEHRQQHRGVPERLEPMGRTALPGRVPIPPERDRDGQQ